MQEMHYINSHTGPDAEDKRNRCTRAPSRGHLGGKIGDEILKLRACTHFMTLFPSSGAQKELLLPLYPRSRFTQYTIECNL